MSLFSSIRLASNTLRANEIALHVVGQNIANANTPGYIREEVNLAPAVTQRMGRLMLGLGVDVESIVQKIDVFLEERLRGSVSERADAETQQASYKQLEAVIGELSDTDLSTSLTRFFSSIQEILNSPEDVSVRNLAVLQGATLTTDINRLAGRVADMRSDVNDRVIDMAESINRLMEEVRDLNVRIANTEAGDVSSSDAVGLRDQRLRALEDLARLIDIRVCEQPSGAVAVYSGADFLVFEGIAQPVQVVLESDQGLSKASIHFAESDSELRPAAGELRGLLDSRDKIMGGFLDRLDDFARTLAFEFNKLYSGGQGLSGFQSVTSESAVNSADVALNQAGLRFTPVNGSFQILVRNKETKQTETTDIMVDLTGTGQGMTLNDLIAKINAINDATTGETRILAEKTADGHLKISSAADQEFAFANDTSGVLAALGINTFFFGSTASDLRVNDVLKADPSKFAASRGGIGSDTRNAVELGTFPDRPLVSKSSVSLNVLYDAMTNETAQASSIAQANAEGAAVFEDTLRGQKLATSGVNIDEEVVRMIAFQRSYQASARYIAALSDLFEILVNI